MHKTYKTEEQIYIAFFLRPEISFVLSVSRRFVASTGSHSLFFCYFFFILIKEIVLFVDILKFCRNKIKKK